MCSRWVVVPSVLILQASAIATGVDVLTLGTPEAVTSTFLAMVLYAGTQSAKQMQLNLARRLNSSLKLPVFKIQTSSEELLTA